MAVRALHLTLPYSAPSVALYGNAGELNSIRCELSVSRSIYYSIDFYGVAMIVMPVSCPKLPQGVISGDLLWWWGVC